MKGVYNRAFDIVADKVKSVDRYSKVISFTFRDKESFGTLLGGFVSIATYIVIALYAYLMMRIVFEKNATKQIIVLMHFWYVNI